MLFKAASDAELNMTAVKHIVTMFFQYVPLKAWLYREGFARFSNTRFSLSSIDDQCIFRIYFWITHTCTVYTPCFMRTAMEFACLSFTLNVSDVHLTNVAVQKTAPDYDPEKVCRTYSTVTVCLLKLEHNIFLIFRVASGRCIS